MGTCCSKKSSDFAPITPKSDLPIEKSQNPNPQIEKAFEEKPIIKENPIINHRKNKQIDNQSVEEIEAPDQKPISGDINLVSEDSSDLGTGNSNLINNGSAIVRTSSCTRDEVEAILIQCGRLSRSSSAVQTPVSGRKYSGSKRSFDFDQEGEIGDVATARESRRQSRPSPNRRRTPSRERDREQSQRSGSRERNINGCARRVSRSPGRRSESPMSMCHNPSVGVIKPGKMVSVPATVSMDKSSNGEGPTAAAVKKVAVKRNAASSPNRRSRSPAARANANLNSNQNQAQGGLSRSNSRKAEQSPYRRNPLGEIDTNAQKQGIENVKNSRTKRKETTQAEENAKAPASITTNNIGVNVVVPSAPEPKPQALTRTRSSRLSRDLDNLNLNLEAQNPSPTSSYTALLLEDIQNFHNKNPVPVSLPQCLSKACSILDEIADLNSSSGPTKLSENKEPPLMETEVVGMNDLMEPSFQKYVTVKRGNNVEREEGEESSGSNSFVGGPQHWISSSLWETNSTDSTDCWASSSRSNTREDDRKKKGVDCPKMGIGQGRLVLSSPAVTAATI